MTERLFYDRIVQVVGNRIEATSSPKTREDYWRISNNLAFLEALKESHIFYVNSAVVESLANLSPAETNYSSLEQMPFQSLFFEMSAPLRNIRGFLFGNSAVVDPHYRNPPFSNLVNGTFYSSVICSEDGDIASILGSTEDIHEYKLGEYPHNILSGSGGDPRKHPFSEISKEDSMAWFSLGANLIDYINAHNVTLKKVDRNPRDIDKINRKRERKRKKLLEPLKPYYLIDIRESRVSDSESQDKANSSVMDYQEWVRGHFQRYHTREGMVRNWIQPYVRGPEDAPWKENRYRVLEDMLKKGPRPTER